jgi:hypothetical protein
MLPGFVSTLTVINTLTGWLKLCVVLHVCIASDGAQKQRQTAAVHFGAGPVAKLRASRSADWPASLTDLQLLCRYGFEHAESHNIGDSSLPAAGTGGGSMPASAFSWRSHKFCTLQLWQLGSCALQRRLE